MPKYSRGRGLHSVGTPTEVDLVEVAGEDLALVELLFQLHCQHRLAELAVDRPFRREVDALHVLLGDRGSTLLGLALAEHVLHDGPGDADGIDAAVVEEVAVLGGEHRLDQHRRQIVVVTSTRSSAAVNEASALSKPH